MRVTWANLPGKPATFTPSPHTHPWSDVTGKPATYAPSAHTHLWADITDKPATFTPAAHTHAWTDITGKPTTFAPSAHTHLWADITDKPSTFPPAAHTHAGLLTQLGTATVGDTMALAVSLGVRRYSVTVTGAAVGDRLIVALTGAPSNGTIQDAYVSSANTVNVGLLVPALGIGAVVAVPFAIYKVS